MMLPLQAKLPGVIADNAGRGVTRYCIVNGGARRPTDQPGTTHVSGLICTLGNEAGIEVFEYDKGMLEVTGMGQLFIATCVKRT
jgi:hypothetical protein